MRIETHGRDARATINANKSIIRASVLRAMPLTASLVKTIHCEWSMKHSVIATAIALVALIVSALAIATKAMAITIVTVILDWREASE